MRGENDLRMAVDRVILGRRFRINNIQGRSSKLSGIEGLQERLLIDYSSPCYIDDMEGGLRPRHDLTIYEVGRLRRQRKGDHQMIGRF